MITLGVTDKYALLSRKKEGEATPQLKEPNGAVLITINANNWERKKILPLKATNKNDKKHTPKH